MSKMEFHSLHIWLSLRLVNKVSLGVVVSCRLYRSGLNFTGWHQDRVAPPFDLPTRMSQS